MYLEGNASFSPPLFAREFWNRLLFLYLYWVGWDLEFLFFGVTGYPFVGFTGYPLVLGGSATTSSLYLWCRLNSFWCFSGEDLLWFRDGILFDQEDWFFLLPLHISCFFLEIH